MDDENGDGKGPDTEFQVRNQLKRQLHRKRVKKLVIWLIVLVLVISTLYLYGFFKTNHRFPWNDATSEAVRIPDNYIEAQVTESTMQPTIDVAGYVVPYDSQDVILRTDGAITAVNAKEGDAVTKGEVLATVDDTYQQYQIASIQAQLDSARLTGNKNQARLLEMQLTNAKNNLVYTTATANFDGVVATCDWEVGDYNVAGTTDNKMIVVDLSKLKATVDVDELDMKYVKVGETADLNFDAIPAATIEARVSKIPMLGTYTSQGIGTVRVELTVDNPPKGLWSGFTFSGTISSNAEVTYVLIPQAAVRSENDKSFVTKKGSDGNLTDIEVKVRYLGEGKCQLLSGDVKVGDTLVIKKSLTLAQLMKETSNE
jgi:RND family efflux transporter MFP subunit